MKFAQESIGDSVSPENMQIMNLEQLKKVFNFGA